MSILMNADLVVVGGGASGLLASGIAAERGLKVILLEPNKILGKKLRITGKGRCNIGNNCDVKTLLANVPVNPRFLYGAFSKFDSSAMIAFFEDIGVPLKFERGNRVFPQSDNANDIAEALLRFGRKNGVRILHERATAVNIKNEAVRSVTTHNVEIECKAAIICTGGLSYPRTGSTGDGYMLAKKLGHTIIKPRASLVPIESDDSYCSEMQGFSLKNVLLRVYNDNNKKVYEELGEMLFTHYGVSGPLVLSASAHMRDIDRRKYNMSIDLKPGLDEKKLDTRIQRDFEKYANKEFKNSLTELGSRSMIPVLVRLSGIPENMKVNCITKTQRAKLVNLFKNFPVSVKCFRPISEAIVTSGGVCVKEIDPKTMQSKLVKNLHFSGEVIDVDAYTGGYNLQIAWSTAHSAANSVCCD